MDEWEFADEVDILAKLPSNFDELRESKKWQERKEALDALNALLEANIRLSTKASYGEILGNLQTMLAKDANINVCALTAKCIKCFATGLRAKFAPYAQSIIPIVFEKLKEKKPLLKDPLIECADAIAATITSLEIIVEEILASMGKPNPQIKQQVDNFLFRQMNILTSDKAPKKLIKAVVPLLIKHSCDADHDVREASLGALGAIQRLVGDKNLRSMIGDLSNDETKMKRISEFAEKASQLHAEAQAKLAVKSGPQATAGDSQGGSDAAPSSGTSGPGAAPVKEADPWDFLEPVDVLAKLPADFSTNIESKKWTERRDALQAFLDILTANPKLDPKASYGEHISLLKRIIEKDANINVAALAAKCMKLVAEGLRKKFAPHAPGVVPAIFDKFKEKKPLLRDPLVECIDAIAATTTLEAMGEDILAALEKPNPNIKIQTDLFLYRAFKLLNSQTMPKKTLKSIAPLLIKHTGDSDAEVRDASYAALGSAMRAIGEKACLPLLSDILEDKLKMGKIKEFYQKACEEAGPEVITQMVQSIHKADAPPSKKAEPTTKTATPSTREPSSERPASAQEEEPSGDDESLKPPAGAASVKKIQEKKKEVPKKVEEEEEPVKKPPDELLTANDEKQQRLKDERTLKILKWNFTFPTEEHVMQLQEQLGRHAKASLMGMLFHKDFKQHLKAIELLNRTGETNPEALVKNSDLLLKWCTLRFYETNPAVLIKVLEFSKQVLVLVRSFDEPMSSEEMYAFVPHLLLKSGEQKENMRNAVRDIIDEITDICGPFKMCPTLLEALKTKNARQRAECLQVLELYIARAGLTQLKSLGIHKAIAACVSDRDNNVRSAAINGLVACYREEGDQMWRAVGKMGDKERAMVEERIKRSGAAPGSAAPRGGAGPVKVGGKIVVPPGAASAVRRPHSRSASARRDDSESRTRDNSPDGERAALNGTFTHGDDGGDRLNSTITYARPRYTLDDDYVEQGSVNVLNTTQALADMDNTQHRLPTRHPVVSQMPTTPLKRSGSSSSISSIDTMDQLEKVIQNISSGLIDVAKDALEQVQFLLSVDDQRGLLEDRMDMLMQTVGTQLKLVRNLHGIHTPKGQELLKIILNFLSPLTASADKFARMNVGEDATNGMLWELVHTLLKTQSDPICSSLPDSVHFGRSLNALVIRLCIRVERTTFFAACTRCLLTSLLEDPDCEAAQLFTKCLYKWADTMSKHKTVIEIDLYLRSANRFYEQIQPKVELHDAYRGGIRTIEMCSEQAMIVMGPALLEKLKRFPRPNVHFLQHMQVCFAECQKINPAGWGLSLPGAVVDPPVVTKSNPVNGSGRSELQILVDNVVRDLPSFDKHTSLLVSYMDKHPQDAGKLEEYLKTVPLAPLVREFMEKCRTGRLKMVGSVTEQQAVSAAQTLFISRSRFEAMRQSGRGSVILPTPLADSPIASVLQARDINADSFSSEAAIPVPVTLNETKAKLGMTSTVQKKRRTMDSATHTELRSRLAGLGAD
ncbi:hypothetical protein Y032_0004g1910 [Ancylostoma ceylanicum]|uniref:TOG domain-containing protein n=1 Tax=Ancylostoma ceylanicum TaxID=53326 RepID=A0A016VWA2_9BILA|nr:hypothetical protein Y032_0004g1910 [Ancylostoma ceylanicum]